MSRHNPESPAFPRRMIGSIQHGQNFLTVGCSRRPLTNWPIGIPRSPDDEVSVCAECLLTILFCPYLINYSNHPIKQTPKPILTAKPGSRPLLDHVPLRIRRNSIHRDRTPCLLEANVRRFSDVTIAIDRSPAIAAQWQRRKERDAQGKGRAVACRGAGSADQELVVDF